MPVDPFREELWVKFIKELEETPVQDWEFYGHRSGLADGEPERRNQLYKLMLRPTGRKRKWWWWFEEHIAHFQHDPHLFYRDVRAWYRLSGSAMLLEFLAAQVNSPIGDDKPAIERAVALVRQRIAAIPRV